MIFNSLESEVDKNLNKDKQKSFMPFLLKMKIFLIRFEIGEYLAHTTRILLEI